MASSNSSTNQSIAVAFHSSNSDIINCSSITPDTQVQYWKAAVVIALVFLYRINTVYAITPLGKKVFPLLCSVLLIVAQVASPMECYCAIHDNFPTLLTLIGMMIFSAVLEKNHVMPVLRKLITAGPSWMKSRQLFILRVSLITVIISALITNDCCCVLMVPLVVEGLQELDFKDEASIKVTLLAVTMSSNIGATLLPMGSPQTLIIFGTDGLTFSDFLFYMSVPVFVAFLLNYAGLITYYYCYKKCLSRKQQKSLLNEKLLDVCPDGQSEVESSANTKRKISREQSHLCNMQSIPTRRPDLDEVVSLRVRDSRTCKHIKITLLLVLLFMYPIYLIIGDQYPNLPGVGEIGWTSMLLGSLGLLVHWSYADQLINKEVDWGIIVFFIGAFALMSTLVNRGVARIPVEIFFKPWTLLDPSTTATTTQPINLTTTAATTTARSAMHTLQNSFQVAASTLLLSNLIGNVPLVLVVLRVLTSLRSNKMLLLLLSYVAAVAGNLTFIGAATHIIVSEHEKKLITPKDITSYGILSTIPTIVIGVVIIWSMVQCNDPFSERC